MDVRRLQNLDMHRAMPGERSYSVSIGSNITAYKNKAEKKILDSAIKRALPVDAPVCETDVSPTLH
jgi:hypothetical protein